MRLQPATCRDLWSRNMPASFHTWTTLGNSSKPMMGKFSILLPIVAIWAQICEGFTVSLKKVKLIQLWVCETFFMVLLTILRKKKQILKNLFSGRSAQKTLTNGCGNQLGFLQIILVNFLQIILVNSPEIGLFKQVFSPSLNLPQTQLNAVKESKVGQFGAKSGGCLVL